MARHLKVRVGRHAEDSHFRTVTDPLGISSLTSNPGPITHGYQMNKTNTGPTGAGLSYGELTPSGTITTSSNGQIIENMDITGNVQVRHNNVTVRNCRIDGNLGVAYCIDFAVGTPVTGTLIEYCELLQATSSGIVHFSPYTMRYCESWNHPADASKIKGDSTIEYCYFHSLYVFNESHNDNIQMRNGGNTIIRYNRLECIWQSQTGAILVQAADANIGALTVENNLLGGGGYTFYTTIKSGSGLVYTEPPEVHGNYFAGEDGSPSAINPNNSWLAGPRSNQTTTNESGNFYAPLLDPVNHPTPWAIDLNDLRVRD